MPCDTNQIVAYRGPDGFIYDYCAKRDGEAINSDCDYFNLEELLRLVNAVDYQHRTLCKNIKEVSSELNELLILNQESSIYSGAVFLYQSFQNACQGRGLEVR